MNQKMIDLKFMLQQTGELETEIEKYKQNLIGDGAEYNTIDAFRFIDQSGKGVVDHNEIVQFLSAHFGQSLQFTDDDVGLFIQRFDKNVRNSIKYSEFCTAFAPVDQNFQGVLSGRKP
jgi:Ca2+-binding EF-hand superfamily protein